MPLAAKTGTERVWERVATGERLHSEAAERSVRVQCQTR
jgi:hypothetical protein